MAVELKLVQKTLTNEELNHMARCLTDFANEIDFLFPIQANSLRNMSRVLAN